MRPRYESGSSAAGHRMHRDVAGPLPPDRDQPGPRTSHRQRPVSRGYGNGAALLPAVEARAARVVIYDPRHPRSAAVAPPIVQNVGDGTQRLRGRVDGDRVIAVVEQLAAASERPIDPPGRGDLECLHSPAQYEIGSRFRDDVKVIVLDARVDDPEPL